MTKKGIISAILIAIFVGIGFVIVKHTPKNPDLKMETKLKTPAKTFDIENFHSDILELIVSSGIKVYNISPEEAKAVLEKRIGEEVDADKKPADVKELPFDIVRLISQSSASIAGISPKKAGNEILRRYLALDTAGEDDIDSAVLINALQQKKQSQALEKWAENEDAEAIDSFIKEKADADPESIENLAYGMRHLGDKHDEAVTYMERYANHPHGDSFDTKNEKETTKALLDTIKSLK